MKNKLIYSIIALGAAMSFSSCSSEDELAVVSELNESQIVHVTVTAGRDDDSSTRSELIPTSNGALECNWKEGDQLVVFSGINQTNKGKNLGVLTLTSGKDTNKGVFEGDIEIKNGQDLFLVYLGTAKTEELDKIPGSYTFDITKQDGSIAGMNSYDFMNKYVQNVTVVNKRTNIDVTMNRVFAHAHFSVDSDEFTLDKGDVIIVSTSTEMPDETYQITGKAEMDWSTSNLSMYGVNSITVTKTDSGKDLYLTLMPCNGDVNGNHPYNLRFEIVKDGVTYTASLGTHTWVAGTYVTATGNSDSPIKISNWTKQEDWVDFGLTSGNLWRNRNIGADSESGYGTYFAWGESREFNSNNIRDYCAFYILPKFNSNGGAMYVDYQGNSSYDTTVKVMSETGAVTPNQEDWIELIYECELEWTARNGIQGVEFSKNGKTIFVPTAGWKEPSGTLKDAGSEVMYWTSELKARYDVDDTVGAAISFTKDNFNLGPDDLYDCEFYVKAPIRPIKKAN